MHRSPSSPRSTISAASGRSTTTAIAPWNGTTTATAVTPGGSCASTASHSPAQHRGRSCRWYPRRCCVVKRTRRWPLSWTIWPPGSTSTPSAWGQRYAVVTACRVLYTLDTAGVASKAGALEWGMRTLEPRWRPLLAQVRDERRLGWDPHQPPQQGEADAARAFAAYATGWRSGEARPT
jgi:hypothetical protein